MTKAWSGIPVRSAASAVFPDPRALALAVLSVALLPVRSGAQVEVSCRLRHGRVLQYEPVEATVVIRNNTAEPLRFRGSGANARLGFDIEQSPGVLVMPTGERLVPAGFTVAPGGTASADVNLLYAYQIRATGPYTVTARVDWNGRSHLSGRQFLDVLPGLEVARLDAVVPGEGGGPRVFSLRTLTRDREERLFLRVEDERAGQCYGVIDLGGAVRQFPPSLQVDGSGRVHVLHQAGPTRYLHSVFDARARAVNRQSYSGELADVRMSRTEGGDVVVDGGTPARGDPRDRDDDAERDRDPNAR